MNKLHYDIHPGNGPAMLMVHGFLSSRAQWIPNLEQLARVCTPVTVELYGHGRSPSPTDPAAYMPAGYLEQFEIIRKEIGAEQWYLCGFSLGASLTIRYAFDYPQQTIAHIFTNSSSAISPRPEPRPVENLIKHFEKGGLEVIEKIPVHPKYATRLPPKVTAELIKDARSLNPVGIARGIAYTNTSVSLRDELDRNTRPALLVCGEQEQRFQPHRKFVAKNMPHTKFIDVPAAHAVNAQCPTEFNQAVINFITNPADGSHIR